MRSGRTNADVVVRWVSVVVVVVAGVVDVGVERVVVLVMANEPSSTFSPSSFTTSDHSSAATKTDPTTPTTVQVPFGDGSSSGALDDASGSPHVTSNSSSSAMPNYDTTWENRPINPPRSTLQET